MFQLTKRKRNVEEGRGFTLGGLGSNSGKFDFASSNEMWRAAIDVLDFTPLINADYGGGIIITDWYSDDSSKNGSIKISVQFLSNEIRADGLDVKIYNKSCDVSGSCKIVQVNSGINAEIKMAILKKAAQLKKSDLKKKRAKKNGG